jgi:RNA polymerase sigma-70 factor (ECF subfamily)
MMAFALQVRQSSFQDVPAVEPDGNLVQRAKTDPQAFAALYTRYADPIFRHCYRRLGSREAAEDATSQVFTQALAALQRFDDSPDSFRAWLFTIANHVLADQHRAAKRHTLTILNDDLPDRHLSPEEQAVAMESARTLREAIQVLPPRERQVVELRLAGLTGAEIGQVLGCRPNAIAVAHFRAVNRLRGFLGVETHTGGDSHA